MSGCIAVINAGSSSIKFALYGLAREADVLYRGQVEGLGVSPHLIVRNSAGQTIDDRTWPAAGLDHGAAAVEILGGSCWW